MATTRLMSRGLWLLLAVLCLVVAPGRAEDLAGRWQVRQFTTTTYTLDGKRKVKGPLVMKSSRIFIEVRDNKYVEEISGKRTQYTLTKQGSGYVLTRKDENGRTITIILSSIKRSGSGLTFTSTRSNRETLSRTVVQWVCVPAGEVMDKHVTLKGHAWSLVAIEYNNDSTARPLDGEVVTLTFGDAGKVMGKAGANRYNGTYQVGADGALTVGPLVSTRAANPPGSVADKFLKDLQDVKHYLFREGQLILTLPADAGILRFKMAPNSSVPEAR